MQYIEIDGSYGEGGGQIIRTALSLSSITGKAFRISNIRSKRGNPGLQPQHVTACLSVRKICRGNLEGAFLQSNELIFEPGEIVGGKYVFDVGTAGSVTLVAQAVLPILLLAKKKSYIEIIGGTHVIMSPGFDYFSEVFLSAVRCFGPRIDSKMIAPGYYPAGAGRVSLSITGNEELAGVTHWPQENTLQGLIRLSKLPEHIAQREKKVLLEGGAKKVRIYSQDAISPGNPVTLWRGFCGAYVLGEKGWPAESVAKEALRLLEEEEDAQIDRHLADQLLLYAALAKGRTSFKTSQTTEHLKTNAYIVSLFTNRNIETKNSRINID